MNWHNFRALLPNDEALLGAFDEYAGRDLHERVTLLTYVLMMHDLFDQLPEKLLKEQAELGHITMVCLIVHMVEANRLSRFIDYVDLDRVSKLADTTAVRAALDSLRKKGGHSDKDTMDFFLREASAFTDRILTEMKRKNLPIHG
jgi:hypothetical protein